MVYFYGILIKNIDREDYCQMIDKLYISDLDGTLLNSDASVSEFTKQKLNELIANGLNFTVATARSIATVKHIFDGVNLHLPIILMNGVLIYDFKSGSFIRKCVIPAPIVATILSVLKNENKTALMYKIIDGQQRTYFEASRNEHLAAFIKERQTRYQKPFWEVSFDDIALDDTIYFALLDTRENILPIYEALKNTPELRVEMYPDIYSDTLWYLEIFSVEASKKTSSLYLQKLLEAREMIGFGDNLNDLPLFEACDFCCAVGNARDEVKVVADIVIDTNNNDGVVRWLDEYASLENH